LESDSFEQEPTLNLECPLGRTRHPDTTHSTLALACSQESTSDQEHHSATPSILQTVSGYLPERVCMTPDSHTPHRCSGEDFPTTPSSSCPSKGWGRIRDASPQEVQQMIRLLVSTPLNQRVVKAPPADSATVSTTAKSRAHAGIFQAADLKRTRSTNVMVS
jgi:hypothetical protein